jgi:type 1 fimbria pilin
MKKTIMKRLACLAWLGLLASFLPGGAQAACRYVSGSMLSASFSSPGTINVPSSTAYPVFLGSMSAVMAGDATIQCAAPNPSNMSGGALTGISNAIGTNQPSMPGRNLLPTNVPGISFMIQPPDTIFGGACCYSARGEPRTVTSYVGRSFSVYFYKTGPVKSGTLRGGVFAYWRVDTINAIAYSLNGAINFVEASSCKVATNSVTVILPTINSYALPSVGSTHGRTPFSLPLTCTGSGVAVSVQLDRNGAVSSIPGVLSSTGTAAGVDVQLLDQNLAAVPFGSKVPKGKSTQSMMNIPFYAQYYRTGTVSPGTVRASATFTFSYP